MKTHSLDRVSSAEGAKAALESLLPGQSLPWLLRAADGDVIAYFNVVDGDIGLVGPAIKADISGRHYDKDQVVLAALTALQHLVGGVIVSDQ
jgi:hypothetical protein